MASYHVAYNIAKSKKPQIAKEMLKPFLLQMTKIVLGREALKKLELVLLSNNVFQSQISNLSSDILDQVIADIKASPLKISLWNVSSDVFYHRKIDKTCSNFVEYFSFKQLVFVTIVHYIKKLK